MKGICYNTDQLCDNERCYCEPEGLKKEIEDINKPYMMADGLHALSKEHKHSLAELLTEEQIEILQDVHAKNYIGTDDDMPDKFEHWLTNLDDDEIINYLGHVK